VQFLDGQMPVALGEQKIAKGNALACWPQACAAQSHFNSDRGFSRHQDKLRLILASSNQVS
jgi:hypothetical protein